MISIKIDNPPKGINENQCFLDQEHLQRWLDTHSEKFPNSKIENGSLTFDSITENGEIVNNSFKMNVSNKKETIESLIKPVKNKKKQEISNNFAKPISFWQKVINFVKNLTHGKITSKAKKQSQ